jgi:cysteinyl-tRNA synthetase
VMDYSAAGDDETAFTAHHIATLKDSPSGPKILLAYMSIGEAEDYRFYWNPDWDADGDGQPDADAPAWLDVVNPDWKGNYKIRYWDPGWQAIIYGGPDSYLDKIIAAGFDGVYLDIIDAYGYYEEQGRDSAAREMVDFVIQLAGYARALQPGFLIFPQNAAELAADFPDYLAAVDGIGQEEVYYGYPNDGDLSSPDFLAEVEPNLDLFVQAGKTVLATAYTTDPTQIDDQYARARARGYVPFATVRDLDQLTINAGHEPAPALPTDSDRTSSGERLADVTHWFYMIDVNLKPEMVKQIATSAYDMVVLDFIPSEENNTDYAMADVIAQLHNAPHHFDCAQCKPKLVIAYIDIGQAEEFRTYWHPGWDIGNPEWIVGADPDGWEGNFPVTYWYDEWREIWLGEDGYLQAILDAGFEGVYLDWVEAYSDENVMAIAEREGVDPKQEMIWWVGDIADFGRTQRPDFIVIAQNAAELATDDDYLAVIDAIAQEQVWFDGGADNNPPGDCPLPRTEAEVETKAYVESLSEPCRKQYDEYPDSTLHASSEEYLHYLTLAHDKGEIIFTVDYALEPDNVVWVYQTSRALGFVPFASNRALDRYIEPVP